MALNTGTLPLDRAKYVFLRGRSGPASSAFKTAPGTPAATRPDPPPQRGPQPARVGRGLRPRGPAGAARMRDARRPPTIGVNLWPQDGTWARLRDAAGAADRAARDSGRSWD